MYVAHRRSFAADWARDRKPQTSGGQSTGGVGLGLGFDVGFGGNAMPATVGGVGHGGYAGGGPGGGARRATAVEVSELASCELRYTDQASTTLLFFARVRKNRFRC